MSTKNTKKRHSPVRDATFAVAVALPMSLLGGWAAYGSSGSAAVAAAATGAGLVIGLVIYLVIALSGRSGG